MIGRKIHNSMYQQLQRSGIAAPVRVLLDLSILSKLSRIMREIWGYAAKNNLKASWTFYKQWAMKNLSHAKKLWFAESGAEDIEKAYATHYIDPVRITELKQQSPILSKTHRE